MSAIPPIFSRVPNLLQSQAALASINRTQVALFQVQQQLATGKAITRFSDDAVKAAAISVLIGRLDRGEQFKRNLDHADSSLSTLDKALGDASDLVLEAKGIASAQVGIGASASERAGQAQVVNSLLQTLLGIGNREGIAGHVFGGSTPGTAPIEAFLGGYRYRGQGDGLLTDLGLGADVPITIGGNNAIGSASSRVHGDTDLDPGLTGATRLSDLTGGRGLGVTLGRIEFSFDGGPRTQIDLTGADSVSDVTTRIQNGIRDYEQANNVTILGPGGVSFSGGSLRIDVAPGVPTNPSLQFFDTGNGTTAQDLGLAAATPFSFSATTPSGLELGAKLTWQTPLSSLRGITGPLGSIKVNNLGQSRIIDLSSAQTLEDVKNAIEGAGIGLRVETNSAGNGIDVVNEVAAGRNQAMSIEEISGGNFTATRLGIRSFSASTRITDFNDGRGVHIADGAVDPTTGLPDPTRDVDFAITLGDSPATTFTVDLRPQDLASVQTVIDRINQQAQAAGVAVPADFNAGLSDSSNGLVLTQNASFTGAIAIATKNNSPAADELGLTSAGGGTYEPSTGSLRAADHAKVRVDNLFTQLIDLRDALLNNDTSGITVAGERLESSVDRLAQTRALVGGYAQRVSDGIHQQEDQSLLDEKTRSDLQDADYTQAAVRLSLLQTQLQAGLQTTASAFARSLLDFLG